ncbi:MAG: AbrB/MazE/SpoVT family DNA-binding domain-containing protein [Candidatus Heimdallarchaeota archaeon]
MSGKIVFERKVIYNAGVYKVSIPVEIVKAIGLEKGDTIGITFENGKFVCEKIDE